MAPQPFTVVSGLAAPVLIPNIDTDVIIRVDRMMDPEPGALAKWAFESIRYGADGEPRRDFALNDPAYAGSEILLAGNNFGCGSSREPAVWAVMRLGFRCVIAPSFGDIFRANCLTNGVLPMALTPEVVDRLAEGVRHLEHVTVDLPSQTVTFRDHSWSFEIGQVHKLMLVDGIDEMELAMRHLEGVERWEARDHLDRPWAWFSEGSQGEVR
jgi:3-isopropylmalate/(R)-2-methylmalate dehydratase small subunit